MKGTKRRRRGGQRKADAVSDHTRQTKEGGQRKADKATKSTGTKGRKGGCSPTEKKASRPMGKGRRRGVSTPKRWGDLDPTVKKLLLARPKRSPLVRTEEVDGRDVIIYKKEFGRFERGLHRVIKGPKDIRRPLDEPGTMIWRMCDGKHSVHEICKALDEKYKEDIEPVVPRVWGFLHILLDRNLIHLEKGDEGGKGEEGVGEGEEEGKEEEDDREGEESQEIPPEEEEGGG